MERGTEITMYKFCCDCICKINFILITSLALCLDGAYAENAEKTEGLAKDIRALDEHRLFFQGDAEVKRGPLQLRADQLEYDKDTDIAKAQGQVCFKRDDLVVNGPQAQLQVDANEGYMDQVSYQILSTQGKGTADKIYFRGPGQYRGEQITYSTCRPGKPDWLLRIKRLDIDDERKVATGETGVMYFLGMPIAASPYLKIPLSDERRSGILPPTVGTGSNSGIDITVPYYFNIAPNRDLTLFPRLLSKRGAQLGSTFRYLNPNYKGNIQAEFLHNDRVFKRDRWFYRIQHQQQLLSNTYFYIDRAKVSDDSYPSDLGRNLSAAVQQQFNQEVGVTYSSPYWTAQARVQKFQTLSPNTPPFDRQPQMTVRYKNSDLEDILLAGETDFTEFRKVGDPATNSQRTYIKPEISYIYRKPAFFIIPKASLHASAYSFNQTPVGATTNHIQRVVPTVSLDTGLIFERAESLVPWFGKRVLQTMEPRLFYVYTPFREQSNIPLFDTASADFNLTQIFSEQPFMGNDRVADNNKLTAGLTSRFLEADSGNERARFVLAQRLDMHGQRVTLTNTATQVQRSYSDVLAVASVRLSSQVAVESAVQYTMGNKQLQRSSIDLSWRPGAQRTMNFGYRYQRPSDVLTSPLRQFVVSGQWPITSQLYGIARANYDRVGHKLVDSLVGFEYDADCWVGRLVLQRFTNNTQGTTSNFYFQIEFKGLAKIGLPADTIFKLNVPGYTPLSSQINSPFQPK